MAGNAAKLKAIEAQENQRRLSREQLLTPKIRQKEIDVPGLDGTVLIQSLSFAVRSQLRQETGWGTEDFDEPKFTLLSVVYSIVDPKLEPEDIEALKEQDQGIFDMIILELSMLNMLGQTDVLKKEWPTIGSSDSASNSQETSE